MNKITVILINAVYEVYENGIIYGSYASSAIALSIANDLTGLAYTNISQYLVSDSNGNEYTQNEIYNLKQGQNDLFYIISGVISQEGTNAPTVTYNQNDTGNTYTPARDSEGHYTLTRATGTVDFTDSTELYAGTVDGFIEFYKSSTTVAWINTLTAANVYSDDYLTNKSFLIKIPK